MALCGAKTRPQLAADAPVLAIEFRGCVARIDGVAHLRRG
jgi:hypothetical protein